jgi:pimeloyl-ACP methyl ester carboxylesterase
VQILLVHGLGRTPLSMFGLAAALRRGGHHTRFFGYSPPFESVPRITRRLTHTLRTLARFGEPVGLIGHSLGGLFLRVALAAVPELRVHHLVLLGSPAVPPRMARLAWKWFPPFRLFTRDCGKFLMSPGAFAALSEPSVPFTVIAGTAGPYWRWRWGPFADEPNDGVVAVSEARIGSAEPVLLPVFHSVLMDAPTVRARISAIMSGASAPSPSFSGR